MTQRGQFRMAFDTCGRTPFDIARCSHSCLPQAPAVDGSIVKVPRWFRAAFANETGVEIGVSD